MHRLSVGWRPTPLSNELCLMGTYSRVLTEFGYTKGLDFVFTFLRADNTAFLDHRS